MPEDKRIIFSTNSSNQLGVRFSSENKLRVLNGEFKIDKTGNLIYLVNEPSNWLKVYNLPKKIKFKGNWKLNSNHDLVFEVKEKDRDFEKKRLVLKGEILDCQENYLIFKIKSRISSSLTRICLLKLKGRWGVDRFNRITFSVTKKENPDILTFKGSWQVNKNQQIVYKYEKLKTKDKKTLVFKGFWDISSRNRLSYILGSLSTRRKRFRYSSFDFRAYLESSNIYPHQGRIKYRVGIGYKKERKERIITLYGAWKFSRRLGLIFEMDYAGKIRRSQFGATVNLSKKDKVIFILKSRDGQPIGISLTFTRNLLSKKDFEYFLRLKKEAKSKDIELGATLRF